MCREEPAPCIATKAACIAKRGAAPAAAETMPPLLLFAVGAELEGAAAADEPTTPRGGHGLVHLRDVHELREYGVGDGDVVYVCLDSNPR